MANDTGKTAADRPGGAGGQRKPGDGSQPGVLGDWTEEQDLGQPGNPDARITQQEVEEAFGQQKGGTGGQQKPE
jgi:hypothetical protein